MTATATDGAKQPLGPRRCGTDARIVRPQAATCDSSAELLLVERRHQAAVDDQRVDARIRSGGPRQFLGLDDRVESGKEGPATGAAPPRRATATPTAKDATRGWRVPCRCVAHRRRDRLGGAQGNVIGIAFLLRARAASRSRRPRATATSTAPLRWDRNYLNSVSRPGRLHPCQAGITSTSSGLLLARRRPVPQARRRLPRDHRQAVPGRHEGESA